MTVCFRSAALAALSDDVHKAALIGCRSAIELSAFLPDRKKPLELRLGMKMPHEAKQEPVRVQRPKNVLPRAILEQSGNRCAFPGCSHRTYLEIAHIRAESAGGPRYDPEQPTGPGTANLIVLCPSHHRLVDSQPHRYSVDVLQKFRMDALAAAQGRPVDSRSSAQQQALGLRPSTLREALQVWYNRTGNESEGFWHRLFEDVPGLLALAVPGDTIQYGSKCYVGEGRPQYRRQRS